MKFPSEQGPFSGDMLIFGEVFARTYVWKEFDFLSTAIYQVQMGIND